MRLRLQTDFALRVLLFLGFVDRKATADEIARSFDVSRDHLVKVVQLLSTHGFVRTPPGRRGGMILTRDPRDVTVREVVEKVEGRHGVLDCVTSPEGCPMEPGCDLRRLLMSAEEAFYNKLESTTLADLTHGKRRQGGLYNLQIHRPAPLDQEPGAGMKRAQPREERSAEPPDKA